MKIVNAFLIIAIVAMGVVIFILYRDSDRQDKELKNLKENVDIVIRYDSIISARERVLLDSIKVVREALDENKRLQHHENLKLRQRNQALEKQFRDLDLSDRPDF